MNISESMSGRTPVDVQPAKLDPITVAVIGSALSTIAEEMGKALIRAAYSTNIKERQDCSTALFDTGGHIIAQAEHIPIHLGSLLGIAGYVLEHHDMTTIRPGDVFIGNDAYTGGGTHLNDIVLIEPVFFKGELVGWVANLAHHSDFVDRGHAHIFQEGLRIPPVRLYKQGVLQDDVMDLILLNCQVPHERTSDFRAQMAANRLGVQRFQDLCERYGRDVVDQAAAEILDYTERRTRAGIALIADGVYEFQHEFDTNLIDDILDLKVRVSVQGEELFVDFPDAPPQVRAPINMVFTALQATVFFAVRALVDPDIPANAGFHRPIHISAPAGSVLNSTPPAAVYSRTDIAMRLVDMIFAALAPVLPERVVAASTGGILLTTSGMHPRTGRFYVYNEMQGGGMGARARKDGLDGVQVNTTNSANLPIEALETEHPVMVECYELVRDSGGPGEYRGGMTMRRRVRILDHEAMISAGGTNSRLSPYGIFGGHAGSPARVEMPEGAPPLERRKSVLQAGQSVGMVAAGGGGYGDPRHRPRELVLRDLKEDRISEAAARDIYGLDPSLL
ncbi:hydantoinase B/oxoprolinase family protein [Paraburkholderia domus]|uniref:hydantoinase B/oxoprolinase family protein n=1 Tax=Paraburkholderia domus TaxID=2793075 RepID=UPI001B11CDC5|nr:hydantoinase B/oxoprolinase family protein [Paraburkholderia domus]CAE6790322.1 Acetophenone carboxylase delta subunit [Paraburkholderia domus]CAE6794331.1 Acetophenone carboxylase delta subunit [Paraburkholderia domus]CAE6882248.1 Acetophenone carboxylase delta subunit [Paraburkholderia domus]